MPFSKRRDLLGPLVKFLIGLFLLFSLTLTIECCKTNFIKDRAKSITQKPVSNPKPQNLAKTPKIWTKPICEDSQNLNEALKEQNVAIYIQNDTVQMDPLAMPLETEELFHFAIDAWAYMIRTYGNFGPYPELSIVLHQWESYPGVYHMFSLNTTTPRSLDSDGNNITEPPNRNALLIGPYVEVNETTLLNNLAYFVEYSSKGRLGSPSHSIWECSWVDMFTYDVYLNLNETAAELYKMKIMNKSEKYRWENIFWFSDWFLPIYTNHGGGKVLSKYFELLSGNLPHMGTHSEDLNYNYTLIIGEFVHFWSGAAGRDLREIANTTFGWDTIEENLFQLATTRFPCVTLKYMPNCNNCSEEGVAECKNEGSTSSSSTSSTSTSTVVTTAATSLIFIPSFALFVISQVAVLLFSF